MRTKAQIHCLTGHTNTVADVKTQAGDPQVSFNSFLLRKLYEISFVIFRWLLVVMIVQYVFGI
jgi:hypothetical protein